MTEMFTQAFWDERYASSHDHLWSGKPNASLVNEVADLTPGTALEVGCGEGADAIWLAGRGWRVTALDVSTVAIERAARHAADAGDEIAERITWTQADVLGWEPSTDRYDLVTAHYVHLPTDPRDILFRHLADAVSPGGTLLIVGHHPSDLQTSIPRPPIPELFFAPDDVVTLLDPQEWTVVTATAASRSATDPHGNDITIHDAIARLRRNPA
ncbi:class I SAM-dependent methyltransferase [Rhodococcus sp. ABRD24]|uniref:class I SAM-dependent methyltransferase n=1 Tax=Rhodococcus sp. ABRD24 TaxID=2507582 RepID=UPI00103D3BD2|nr:class I SAM-dependent methyltransferase [Rhodococcus sp. ABRD24]QBJ97209.1 class I SAM-dependent methyltransferase [Rhodococcus sp. ABRD24]